MQVLELSLRGAQGMLNNITAIYARVFQVIAVSLMVCALYTNADTKEQLNSMFFVCIAQLTLYMGSTLMEFLVERELFVKEVASRLYLPESYFVSKILIEMPLTFLLPLLECSITFFAVGYR